MGREIKRVALDFDWPLKKVWEGYLNPHYKECESCKGTGSTTAMQRLEDLVSLLMLSGSDSLKGKPHPYFNQNWALHRTGDIAPSKDMAELTSGLAGRELERRVMGHDSIDGWTAAKKIIEAAGLPEKWGYCTVCDDGDGISPEIKQAYESWEETEPAEGEGWQVWENVSEGSPISPVFENKKGLIEWLEAEGYNREAATKFVETGWVMSGMIVNGKMYKDIESAELLTSPQE